MTPMDPLLQQNEWRIIDQTTMGPSFKAIESFAIDDALCTTVGNHQSVPVIRTWVHHDTVVLGAADSRLPYLQDGIDFLNGYGYQVIIRNSGGLAVMLDQGILNISMIFPELKGININRGYEVMWQLIQHLLTSYSVSIEAGEIVGSYCPGSYDLSIDGKKFAGISQRRIRGGIAVQIYICASGSGSSRAKMIKQFYEHSLKQAKTTFTYPTIVPETMASLSELLHEKVDVQTLQYLLFKFLSTHSKLRQSQLTLEEIGFYHKYLERMIKRNDKVFTI